MLLKTLTQETWQTQFTAVVALLIGIGIPFSTAAGNLGALLLLIGFLLQPSRYKELLLTWRLPLSLISLFLLTLLLLGALWSNAPKENITDGLMEMRVYYLIPIFFVLFSSRIVATTMLLGFMTGSAVLLLISTGMYVTSTPLFKAGGGNWIVSHAHGYHAFFISIFAFILLAGVLGKKLPKATFIVSIIFFALAAHNILFLITSRSGQILFIAMLGTVLFIYNKKLGTILTTFILLLSLAILPQYSTNVQARFNQSINDIKQFWNGNPNTSTGIRLEYHKNTLSIIKESPWIGHGTGSFLTQYQRFLEQKKTISLPQPHNDYLFMSVQIGVIGGLLLLGILFSVAIKIKNKPLDIRLATYPILIHMFIGTLANSLFTDSVTSISFVLSSMALIHLDSLPWGQS